MSQNDYINLKVGKHYYIKHTHTDGSVFIQKESFEENQLANLAYIIDEKNAMYLALGSKTKASIVFCEVTDVVVPEVE
jgi:hypothetical protein